MRESRRVEPQSWKGTASFLSSRWQVPTSSGNADAACRVKRNDSFAPGDKIQQCTMSSRRSWSGTAPGTSRTAPKCPEPTVRARRVTNVSGTCARSLFALCLPTPARTSSWLDETRRTPSPPSPSRLCFAERGQGTHAVGIPSRKPSPGRAEISSFPGKEDLSQPFDPRPARIAREYSRSTARQNAVRKTDRNTP